MTKSNAIYAPVPARVIGNENLTALDHRVFEAIAAHDRLGANGIGCYASHKRLATLVGCHLKSLSRSLHALAGEGLIDAKPHPLNGRLRVYRVIYTEWDAAYLRGELSDDPAPKSSMKGNEAVTDEGPIGNEIATKTPPIGNRDFENVEQDQRVVDVNILGETYNTSCETVGNTSGETTPCGALERAPSKSVGPILAMLERSLKAGKKNDLPRWHEYLEGLAGFNGTLDDRDPNFGRASRLLDEVGECLTAPGGEHAA